MLSMSILYWVKFQAKFSKFLWVHIIWTNNIERSGHSSRRRRGEGSERWRGRSGGDWSSHDIIVERWSRSGRGRVHHSPGSTDRSLSGDSLSPAVLDTHIPVLQRSSALVFLGWDVLIISHGGDMSAPVVNNVHIQFPRLDWLDQSQHMRELISPDRRYRVGGGSVVGLSCVNAAPMGDHTLLSSIVNHWDTVIYHQTTKVSLPSHITHYIIESEK